MKRISIGSSAFLLGQESPTTDFHVIVHKLADLGFDGVELGAYDPHPNPDLFTGKAKREQVRKMVVDHGLAFSALGPDFRKVKLVSDADSGPFIANFAKHLFFAEDLGVTIIRLAIPELAKDAASTEPERIMDRACQAFDLCAKLAAGRGIALAWEFEPHLAISRPDEVVELVRRLRDDLGHLNFGVLFDVAHAHVCAAREPGAAADATAGVLALLERLRRRVIHVHLSDADGSVNEVGQSIHVPFGKGRFDFDRLMPALAGATGPNAWWTVDLSAWPNAWEPTSDCKRFVDKWRRKIAVEAGEDPAAFDAAKAKAHHHHHKHC